MYGWKDDQGNFRNFLIIEHWKYQSGDWVVETGLPDHHLRIIHRFSDANVVRWYIIFDTRLLDVCEYKYRHADELEPKSVLRARPHPDQVQAILARAEFCRGIGWSMWARTDCESIQRWIHTGNESDRWSPQVLIGGSLVLGALIVAANQPPQGRSHYR